MMDVDRRLNRVLRATADHVSGRFPRVDLPKAPEAKLRRIAVSQD